MKPLPWPRMLPGLLAAAVLVAPAPAAAQSAAAGEFNRIIGQMEEHYYNCARGLRGKEARAQAYIDHGKYEARAWEAFLRKYGDSKLAFPARLYLARALEMAKEKDRAEQALDEALADATDVRRMKQGAETIQVVRHSNAAATRFIESHLASLEDPEEKAELHLELLRYIEIPQELARKRKEKKAYKRKKHREIVAAVARSYPKTRAGREAALMVRGLDLKVGDPLVNLKDYLDQDGKPIDLTEYKGKVVLLHFWTGKRSSRRYLSKLIDLYRALKPKGLEVVGINCDYAEDKGRRMDRLLEELGIDWRNYHDGEKLRNRIALIFYVRKFPYNIIIGRDGKIAAIGEAQRDLADTLTEMVARS